MDIKFYGYTYETGTQGLYVSQASNIHYDNGYVENIASPLYAVNSSGITFNGNHLANSGTTTAVAQFAGNVTGSVRDNYVSGSSVPAAFGVCQNNDNAIDFAENTSAVTTTAGCVTNQINPAATATFIGTTVYVNPSATPITSIVDTSVMPGKTLTLYAGGGSFILAQGGNINLGGLPSPLTVPSGSSVVLTLMDLGPTWLVTSGPSIGGVSSNCSSGGCTLLLLSAPVTAYRGSFPSQERPGRLPLSSTTFIPAQTWPAIPSVRRQGDTCNPSDTYTDNNHPGNMLLTAGTAGTGTGIVCGLVSENPSITAANTCAGLDLGDGGLRACAAWDHRGRVPGGDGAYAQC